MSILRSIKTLILYLLCFLIIVDIPWTPLDDLVTFGGQFLLAMLVGAFFSNYAFNIWFGLDIVVCSIVHGTRYRTISGWVGQRMDNDKRYYYKAKVIDLLFKLLGDGPDHCKRSYLWEKEHLDEKWMK